MDIGIRIIQIGGCMFFVGLAIFPLVRFFTGRYFDNVIGLKQTSNPVADSHLLKSFFRAGQYATLIVCRKGMKKSYDRRIFGDLDFREHARLLDKILSFSFCSLEYIGLALGLIGGAVHGVFYLISVA